MGFASHNGMDNKTINYTPKGKETEGIQNIINTTPI